MKYFRYCKNPSCRKRVRPPYRRCPDCLDLDLIEADYKANLRGRCKIGLHTACIQRNKKIVERLTKNCTSLQEIGDVYNISRERVRQIYQLVTGERYGDLVLRTCGKVAGKNYISTKGIELHMVYTSEEVAKILKISRSNVQLLVTTGKINAMLQKPLRFLGKDILRFIRKGGI